MKLLIVTNNPRRASFRQRIGVYLDTLRANGIASEVAKLPSGSHSRRKLFKQAKECDVVFLHKKCLNVFDSFWLRKYSKKIIYDFDDAVMYNNKRPDRDSRSHFIPFRRTVKLADMVIAGNSYLGEHAKPFNHNVEVLPTGLDTKAYKVETKPKNDGKIHLVWVGSKSTLRYLSEIRPALEEIGCRFQNVILRIICDDFFNLANMQVDKRPWSKETETVDLATSDIGLAPLPNDRFTKGKCGFKILQYAAASLPAIASAVGVNSDYIKESQTGFLVKDVIQWIHKLDVLITNPQLRKKMGQDGRVLAKQFDINLIGKQLVDLINQSLQQ